MAKKRVRMKPTKVWACVTESGWCCGVGQSRMPIDFINRMLVQKKALRMVGPITIREPRTRNGKP